MVAPTQRDEVVEIGAAAVGPVLDVMAFAIPQLGLAARPAAPMILPGELTTQRGGHDSR